MALHWRSGCASAVEVDAPTPAVRLGSELPLKQYEAPDLGAVGADVGLDVRGRLTDGGQVDAKQLRTPLQRRRDRPVQIRVVPGPHPTRYRTEVRDRIEKAAQCDSPAWAALVPHRQTCHHPPRAGPPWRSAQHRSLRRITTLLFPAAGGAAVDGGFPASRHRENLGLVITRLGDDTVVKAPRLAWRGVPVAQLESAKQGPDRAACTLIVTSSRRPNPNNGGRAVDRAATVAAWAAGGREVASCG
jgi:hypothetical protein